VLSWARTTGWHRNRNRASTKSLHRVTQKSLEHYIVYVNYVIYDIGTVLVTRILLWFETSKMPIAVLNNKFIQ